KSPSPISSTSYPITLPSTESGNAAHAPDRTGRGNFRHSRSAHSRRDHADPRRDHRGRIARASPVDRQSRDLPGMASSHDSAQPRQSRTPRLRSAGLGGCRAALPTRHLARSALPNDLGTPERGRLPRDGPQLLRALSPDTDQRELNRSIYPLAAPQTG